MGSKPNRCVQPSRGDLWFVDFDPIVGREDRQKLCENWVIPDQTFPIIFLNVVFVDKHNDHRLLRPEPALKPAYEEP